MEYTEEVLSVFSNQNCVYKNNKYDNLGSVSDAAIGEYINLYVEMDNCGKNYMENIIKSATFSAIGSVMLIAAAEKFCFSINNKTFNEAIKYCDYKDDKWCELNVPQERTHSIGFIVQAFYNIINQLSEKQI